MSRTKWLFFISQVLACVMPIHMMLVRVSGGLLKGVIASDGSYIAYYGIPYAKVIGRFLPSIPDPRWKGVKKAINKNIECAQRVTPNSTKGIEDCLILNVYVPNSSSEKLRSVMFFIHGGGFRRSSGSLYEPDHLLKHNVVFVSINYRLDNLGFLCLRIKEAPGNVGLKDQVLALRWVNKNIKAFGGDPSSVTIFGQSAGAASVVYHLLSPMSRGLFRKAIIQSGTSLGYSFFEYDPIFIAHRFAAQFEQDTDNLQELVKLLNSKSDKELLLTRVPRKIGDQIESEKIFVPCVEKVIPGMESFLIENPYKLLSSGKYKKVPIIIGFTNEEGYFFIDKENDTTIRNFNFYDLLPRDLDFPTIEIKKKVALAMKSLYLPDEPISKKNMACFSKYEGDSTITSSVAITIANFLKTNDQPVYVYTFAHSGALNVYKKISGFGNYPGATHSDELCYQFGKMLRPSDLAHDDIDIIAKLSYLWTNFAKYSNPTPEVTDVLPLKWIPADPNNPQVYVVDNNLTTTPLWNERLLFWQAVYSKYRRP